MASSKNLPEEYRPLSAWAYFGYNLLYSIPIVGWVFMIIFALDNSNINRRNFTRSFFIIYLIGAIAIIGLLWSGVMLAILQNMTNS